MSILARVMVLVCCTVLMSGTARATVIDFDDVPGTGSNLLTGTSYGGLTWGTSTDEAVPGNTGAWAVWDSLSYATPHSPDNYVFNYYGADNLWFAFSSPVFFEGAWFATATATPGHNATQVRFRDEDETSDWLTLSAGPQFLAANFSNSTTVWVERTGGTLGSSWLGQGQWFTMDDVTYASTAVPEPSTVLLLGGGLLGLVGLNRRRRS